MAALPPLPPMAGSTAIRPSTGIGATKVRASSGARLGSDDSPEARAMSAQRDAAKQIEAANKTVETARFEADHKIDEIHDSYDARGEAENARESAAYDQQRLKGYERLSELKREQAAELSRTRREGDRELDKLTHYYGNATYNAERAGEAKLQDITNTMAHSADFSLKAKNQDQELEQTHQRQQTEEMRAANEEAIRKLMADSQQEYQRLKDNNIEATAQHEQTFEDKYNLKVQVTADILADLNSRASQGILDVRRDTTQKLAAYSSRQNDPFYRMLDLNVRVSDEGSYYELTANIPEHEQKHVNVAVKGSQLVLTGSRRNEEKIELEPGRAQGTNSYQSFLETFPITWPVDANKMTREFDGDQLIVRIPKKDDYGYHSPKATPPPVARARMERPKFPENLPHVSQDPYAEGQPGAETGRPTDKRRGSGTLT